MPDSAFASSFLSSLPVTGSGLNDFSGRQDWAQGTDIASAASIALPTDGNLFFVTGTTQINTITGAKSGTRIALWFQGILTLSVAGNILPKGGARTTAADELVVFEARDNGGLEWVEVATSATTDVVGPQELTTVDAGVAGGDRASIDGTLGTDALDIQPSRDAAVAATGNIALSGQPNDGDSVVIDDGVNPAVTFEFDNNASVVETPTLRQVVIGASTGDTITNLISAITGAPTLDVTPAAGAGDSVDLTNDLEGSVGNVELTGTDGAAVQTLTGMAGGRVNVAIGAEAVAIGHNAASEGGYGLAVGADAAVSAGNTAGLAIGKNAEAIGSGFCIAVGYDAEAIPQGPNLGAAFRDGSIAVGAGSRAQHRRQVVIGQNAIGGAANGSNAANSSISVGYNARTYSYGAVAIGEAAHVVAPNAGANRAGIAIGRNAYVGSFGGVAIGESTSMSGSGAVGIGDSANGVGISIGAAASTTGSIDAICIGQSSNSDGNQTVVVGRGCQISTNNTVAVGPNNDDNATGNFSAMVGALNDGYAQYSFMFGRNNTTQGTNEDCIMIGRDNTVAGTASTDHIIIGFGCIGPTTNVDETIIIGNAARGYGASQVVIGDGATGFNGSGTTLDSVVIGRAARAGSASVQGGIAIGAQATASAAQSIAIGFDALAYGANGVVIGANTRCNEDNSIAIGSNLGVIDTAGSAAGVDPALVVIGTSITVGANAHSSTAIGHAISIDDDRCVMVGNTHAKFPGHSFQANEVVSIGTYCNFVSDSVVIGHNGTAGTTSGTSGENVAIGNNAQASNDSGGVTAVGYGATALAHRSIAIGDATAIDAASAGATSLRTSVTAAPNSFSVVARVNGNDASTSAENAWINHNAAICIGAQAYGQASISLGTTLNRDRSFKIGAIPLTSFQYQNGTNGSGVHSTYYGCGSVAVVSHSFIDMVTSYATPCRRFWSFPVYTAFFIEDLSLMSYTYDTLSAHGNVSVTGLQRTATATTTTATTAAGTSVAIAVASEAGFGIGDWVLAIEGTLTGVTEKVKGIAKVTGTAANEITIDLQAENQFNDVIGTHLVRLSGSDGNILASTQLTGIAGVNQREQMVGAQTQAYDVIVVEKTADATATDLKLIPNMRGVMQEMKGAWTYN